MDILHVSVTGSMHRKMPHEDPNTGHAVAVGVRDAMQLMPSCKITTGAFCRVAPKQKNGRSGNTRLEREPHARIHGLSWLWMHKGALLKRWRVKLTE